MEAPVARFARKAGRAVIWTPALPFCVERQVKPPIDVCAAHDSVGEWRLPDESAAFRWAPLVVQGQIFGQGAERASATRSDRSCKKSTAANTIRLFDVV